MYLKKKKTIISFLIFFLFKFAFSMVSYDLDVEIKNNKLIGSAVIKTDTNLKIDLTGLNVISKIKKRSEIRIIYEKSLNYTDEIFLTSFYPYIDKLAVYTFKVKLPEGFIPIGQADKIEKKENTYLFYFPYPAEGLVLVARKDYKVETFEKNGLKIYGYFYKNGDIKLLKEAYNYIKQYENMFGKYPYKRFSIVETSYPYGLSFPTLTTINSYIINKPYIINESLAHEVLHQWFGCSVYVNYKEGNWSEGLVTFYSNYRLSKDKKLYRKLSIEKYEAFHTKDEPLSSFVYKKDEKAESLGYSKGMFVFYMLSNLIGEENLNDALKDFYQKNKFKRAGWKDIEKSVSRYLKDANKFFNQWVNESYVPEISLKILDVYYNKNSFNIDLKITQKEDFEFNLPLYVETPFSLERKVVNISNKENKFTITTKYRPIKIYIDPKYEIFRKLSDAEYDPLIYNFISKNCLSVNPENIKDVEEKNVVFYNLNNHLIKDLTGIDKLPATPFVMTFKNPLGTKKTITVINNFPSNLIKHFGNYSDVILENNRVDKKQKISFYKNYVNVYGENDYVSIKEGALSFNKLINKIKDKKAIFIGENHPSFEDHISQLEIIKAIYKNNKNIVIGMEMFQKPFQKYLDEYINGKIDEKTMLLKTQYYKRWGYDYNLYRPIIHFAKENKIRIIALNAPSEIVEKVSKDKIGGLNNKELKQLPDIDFSNISYKDYLVKIFKMHTNEKNFTGFYESQLIWDETMAQTAYKYVKDYTVIVLVGNGHLRYRYGIPSRFERRTGIKPVVILNDDEIKPKIADFVIQNQKIKYIETPKLGVYLKEIPQGLKVESVIPNSIADKLGIKVGDIIFQYNGEKINKVWQLKTFLTFMEDKDFITLLRNNKKLKIHISI